MGSSVHAFQNKVRVRPRSSNSALRLCRCMLTPPPCSPWKPNCCSSDAAGFFHATAPLDLSPHIDVATGWEKAVSTLRSWDRTLITTETSTYVRAECSTKVFRWVDDLELHLRYEKDKAHATIAIRSASRQGWWDFGENRRRVEVLRAQLLASGVLAKPSRPSYSRPSHSWPSSSQLKRAVMFCYSCMCY